MRVAIVALALLAGCAASPGETIRRHTYPPGFEYVTRAELHTAMGALARDAGALDAALRAAPVDGATVVTLLDRLDKSAAELAGGGISGNHPLLGPSLDRFRADLAGARRAAAADPPQYYLAGAVVGSCRYCHP